MASDTTLSPATNPPLCPPGGQFGQADADRQERGIAERSRCGRQTAWCLAPRRRRHPALPLCELYRLHQGRETSRQRHVRSQAHEH